MLGLVFIIIGGLVMGSGCVCVLSVVSPVRVCLVSVVGLVGRIPGLLVLVLRVWRLPWVAIRVRVWRRDGGSSGPVCVSGYLG